MRISEFFRFIRRIYRRAVLCEPEERAELNCYRRRGDFASNVRYVKRLERYEDAFGPFKPLPEKIEASDFR